MSSRSTVAFVHVVAALVSLPCASSARAGYTFTRTFSPLGTDSYVVGLATVPDGSEVYLATDSPTTQLNRTVQKFAGATFVTRIGQAEAPNDVALGPGGNVYLADGFGGLIQEYSASGSYLSTFNGFPNEVPLGSPISVAVDADGGLWAADALGKMTLFGGSGAAIHQFSIPGITNIPGFGQSAVPSDIAIDPTGNLLFVALANRIVGGGGDRVLVLLGDGTLVNELGTSGNGPGELQLGLHSGVAVDVLNRVFVADTGNHRVQIFDALTGQYMAQFGTVGSSDGQLNFPAGVAIDSWGNNVWVADDNSGRVQQFQVPEPASYLLLATGLLALGGVRRIFRRSRR